MVELGGGQGDFCFVYSVWIVYVDRLSSFFFSRAGHPGAKQGKKNGEVVFDYVFSPLDTTILEITQQ